MDLRPLPFRSGLEQYEEQVKALVKAHESGDSEAMRRIKQYHPHLGKVPDAEFRSATFALDDARLVVARAYQFESWPKLADHVEALTRPGSIVCQFESAVDAIITGEVATLESLVRENPALVRTRSTRTHRAMLMHYTAAKGGEAYRGTPPKNAVDVTEMLRRAGAIVDDVAEIHRGEITALGLLRSSRALLRIHPAPAGMQGALIESLLDAGADINGFAGGWQPLMWALAAGCQEAAETLFRRGARVDNIGTAVLLGRLDLVKNFVNEEGSLKAAVRDVTAPGVGDRMIPTEPKTQIEYAFLLACASRRTDIVAFLLQKGVDPAAKDDLGHTALHCAAWSGSMDVVQLLLERGALLEAKNTYDGTVLGTTVWFALNDPFNGVDYPAVIQTLTDAGAQVDAYPRLKEGIAEVLRRHGAT